MRLQLALNVDNLDKSIEFYSQLFNVTPHKIRDGYANFEVAEPPLKLVLFEKPGETQRLNHLGVELQDERELNDAKSRLTDAGLVKLTEEGTTCCFAEQDKVWAQEPDGLAWEWYRITDDEPAPEAEPELSPPPEVRGCC